MIFKEMTPKTSLHFLLNKVKIISKSLTYIKKKAGVQCLFALEHIVDSHNMALSTPVHLPSSPEEQVGWRLEQLTGCCYLGIVAFL